MHETDINTSPAWYCRLRCEQGQALVEYALILMFVSIAAIGLTPVGQWAAIRLGNLAAAL
jgi:Flp pilus assembly pilin Flp